MAMTRSPNYPQLSLPEAIERAQQIYDKEKWHDAPDKVLAEDLGYKGLNGSSLGIISALKKYGLLVQGKKEGWRLSDDALTIIQAPVDSPDRPEAIERSAFAPALFSELHQTFGHDLPSEGRLRYLLQQKKFNPNVLDDVIRVYRDTLAFVTDSVPEYTEDDTTQIEESSMPTQPATTRPQAQPVQQYAPQPYAPPPSPPLFGVTDSQFSATEKFEQRISADCRAVVLFEGRVTKEAIQKLARYLELAQDDYPSIAPPEPSPIAQPTVSVQSMPVAHPIAQAMPSQASLPALEPTHETAPPPQIEDRIANGGLSAPQEP